jgi:hypothetical protein
VALRAPHPRQPPAPEGRHRRAPARRGGVLAVGRGGRPLRRADLGLRSRTHPHAYDTAILDEVPYAGDILTEMPPALKTRLFEVFDLSILWNKTSGQVTVIATTTDETLTALPELIDPDQDGYHDTAQPAPMCDLTRPAVAGPGSQPCARSFQ